MGDKKRQNLRERVEGESFFNAEVAEIIFYDPRRSLR